jgi:hypothetical protein
MVNLDATLLHHFLNVTLVDRIRHIPADAPQNDIPFKVTAFEFDHGVPPRRNHCR